MKIREFAKETGFKIIGKLTYMGKWDLCNRWYMDERGNVYVVDVVIGGIKIIPPRRERIAANNGRSDTSEVE